MAICDECGIEHHPLNKMCEDMFSFFASVYDDLGILMATRNLPDGESTSKDIDVCKTLLREALKGEDNILTDSAGEKIRKLAKSLDTRASRNKYIILGSLVAASTIRHKFINEFADRILSDSEYDFEEKKHTIH